MTPGPLEASPRVVVIADADVRNDLRVRNVTRTLVEAGAEVVAIGPAAAGERAIEFDGEIRLVQVPVDYVMRRTMGRKGKGDKKAGFYGYMTDGTRDRLVMARALRRYWERRVKTIVARLRLSVDRVEAQRSRLVAVAYRVLVLFVRKGLAASVRGLRSAERAGMKLLRRRVTRGGRSGALNRMRQLPSARLREIGDLETALGPAIDEVAPDVIHAIGFRMLPLAEAAQARAAGRGEPLQWIYDLCEEIQPSTDAPMAASLERRHLGKVAAVIIGAPDLERRLAPTPEGVVSLLVPHLPRAEGSAHLATRDIRVELGLEDEVPLAVCVEPLQGSHDWRPLVEAMQTLPELQLVVLAPRVGDGATADALKGLRRAGVADRSHLVADVGEVDRRPLLRSADIGILLPAGQRDGRTEWPSPGLVDLLHAGVPIVFPSEAGTLAHRLGTPCSGRIYDGDGSVSLAAAIRSVLAERAGPETEPDLAEWSWESHAQTLVALYEQVVGERSSRSKPSPRTSVAPAPSLEVVSNATIPGVLGIGPRNGNGMPWAWSQALRRAFPNVPVEVFGVQFDTGKLQMANPCHRSITLDEWRSLEWQLSWSKHVLGEFSHLLIEQGLSVLGRLNGRHFHHDLPALEGHGVAVGLVFRGSEIRDPARHAARERFSPFRDPSDDFTQLLQSQVDQVRPHVETFPGPLFVTTLDLLDDLPRAQWLPHTIDLELWAGDGRSLLDRPRPIVMHAPSKERMKGSAFVDAVCEKLDVAGRIEYRRLRGIPFSEMPATLRSADIVIDQFALGSYGVLASQAMAAGRVVVGHVSDHVRDRLPGDLPIVEADPDTLEEVLVGILDEPEPFRKVAADGLDYVKQFHDGSYVAWQLGCFLGLVDRYGWSAFGEARGEAT